MNTQKILWAVVIMLGISFAVLQLQTPDGVDVTVAQSMNKQGALLLDVREPNEYASIHAPNAKLIPLGQLSSRLDEISDYKEKSIVVMCHSGRRSAKAVSQLKDAGYTRVSNVKGGIMAWVSSGLEVIKM